MLSLPYIPFMIDKRLLLHGLKIRKRVLYVKDILKWESLQAQEKNLPATQKRAIPMITVPASERVFQAKINVGMETSRAG